jgi:hypothetical protein
MIGGAAILLVNLGSLSVPALFYHLSVSLNQDEYKQAFRCVYGPTVLPEETRTKRRLGPRTACCIMDAQQSSESLDSMDWGVRRVSPHAS